MSATLQQPVGLFPLAYRIGTGLAGAPGVNLNLLAFSPEQRLTGTAAVTQATNPPLNLDVDVWGEYSYLTVMQPGVSKILLSVQGNHGGQGSNSIISFKAHLVVGSDWKEGVANYTYFDGQRWVEASNVPAHLVSGVRSHVQPLPLEPGPVLQPHPPILPLYAAPIQTAIAAGDLAQLKSLANLARHQLDQQPQLQAALDNLKSEISRLERR
ncbi:MULTISPECIES: DUF1842 domain-containing protein [Pseudomonas]|uniref:DUF1842 domain-containing protein n=1 Tax=Pseudomonas asplenii TaxID=53407 RepID=A0A0M9GG69_9PSED|nr:MULTISPECIES: DUF1842 domain-containing protein [Pseudomonas]KPA90213.1 hypothetical protein PF66_03347 [Pseudomonas fuscovaginae]